MKIVTAQRPRVVAAVPVNNEADRIGDCLRALALQEDSSDHQILLLLNNCTDDTARIVRDLSPSLPVVVHIADITLPPNDAHAGKARHLAMERAAEVVDPAGILMTTDADGRVYPDWIATSLFHFENGADAVAGRAEIDPVDASLIPEVLHEADAAECAYASALDEIGALMDPDLADPWPRHDEHSGASIAVRAEIYRKAGGMKPIPLGEDRDFGDTLRRIDAKIRHAPEVRVVVSGRIAGRAKGGMADTIRRRMTKMDDTLDDRLEPASDAMRRATLRRDTRALWRAGKNPDAIIKSVAQSVRLCPALLGEILCQQYFGAAWAEIQERSPVLRRRRVAVADLDYEMKEAAAILAMLRRRNTISQVLPTGLVDIPVHDTAEAGLDYLRLRQ